jgi:hypothetical protein
MRDRWYGDSRDLVKWGVLLALAERHGPGQILQVLYHRPSEWPDLEIDGETVPLPNAVIRHFRRTAAATTIEASAAIVVVDDAFDNRLDYHRRLLERIRARDITPTIVFLDPDTGLESRSPTLDHVLESELSDIWNALTPGDVLVFYQHQTNRNGEPWVPQKKQQFERAIGLPLGAAGLARAEKIARDVVFFYAKKADQCSAGANTPS